MCKHHTMKMYGEVEAKLHALVLDRGKSCHTLAILDTERK